MAAPTASTPAPQPERSEVGGGAFTVLARALRSPALRRSLVGFLLFRIAEMATWVALLVWAYGQGGATAAGVIAVAQLIPATLIAPLGSVLADRIPRRRALALGFLLQAVTNLATAVGLFLAAPFWVVAALAGAAASAMTLTRPAHLALLPDIARDPSELTAGNTATQLMDGLADFGGPALAAGIMAVTGPGWVFVAMGAAGFVSLATTRGLHVVQRVAPDEPGPYWSDALAGARVVLRDPSAGILTAMATGQFVVFGLLDILAVVLALELLQTGPAGPGLISSALGIGALLGAAAAISLIGRRRLAPALAIGIVVTGVPIALVAGVDSFVLAIALFGVSGAGLAYFDVAAHTLLQRNVPPQVLARVFGVQEALLMGGTALGSAAVPVLIVLFGIEGAFIAAGVLLPVIGLVGWVRIRRLDDTAEVPTAELELLGGIAMFAALDGPRREAIAAALTRLPPVPVGTEIITQAAVGDRYYLVIEGLIEVVRDGEPLGTHGPGYGFGEIALLRGVPRTATVRAVEETELFALERDDFLLAVTGSAASVQAAETTITAMLAEDPPPAP